MKKKTLSFLLALLVVLSLVPGAALADGGSGLNQDVIDTIAAGVRNWATEIDISEYGVREDEIKNYIINIAYDHPEFFYVFNKYSYKKSGNTVTKIIPLYDTRFSKSDITTFNSVCSSIIAGMPNGTTEEKLLYLHDYIITHCEYDTTKTQRSAYDCLVLGSAVCDGYSRAFLYLCRLAGLDVHVVISEENNHSWNVAKVKNSTSPSGAYYYIDCTWDDPSTNKNLSHCLHDQFLMYKEKCTERHLYDDWINEAAESVYGYGTNEAYRNYWWTKCIRPVQWVGSIMCYAKSNDYSHVFFRNSGSASETAINLPSGAAAAWSYSGGYITVASLSGNFYFSTPTQIWQLTTGKQMTLVYTLTTAEQAKGEIYGLQSKDGKLAYYVAASPTAAPSVTNMLTVAAATTATVTGSAQPGKNVLGWTKVNGATAYRVFRRANSGGSWSDWTVVKNLAGTSWTDSAVTAGTQYQYRLRACVGGSYCEYSNIVTLTAQSETPTTTVTGSSQTGKNVLNWTSVSGATAYRVFRRANSGSGWSDWTVVKNLNAVTWTDSEVVGGTQYQYRLRACVGGSYGGYSNIVTLSSPAEITGTAQAGKNAVSWSPVIGAAKYQVYRREYNGGAWSSWTSIKTQTAVSLTDAPVTAGNQYQYRVRAYVDGAYGAYSNIVTLTAMAASPTATVTGSSQTGKNVLNWTAVSGATAYRVFRRVNSGSGWSDWTAVKNLAGTSWTDSGITAGNQYQYRVRACVGGSYGGYSNIVTLTAPASVAGSAQMGKNAISWSKVTGATAYKVYRRVNSGSGWDSWTAVKTLSGTSWTDTGVTSDRQYQYRVRAYVDGAYGAYSNIVTLTAK